MTKLLFSWLFLLAGSSSASAQVVWQDSLDAVGTPSVNGPSNLLAAGYEFRTAQTGPAVPETWRQGPWHAGQIAPHEGTGYLTTSLSVPAFSSGTIARWMILPPGTGTAAGQDLSLWVQGFTGVGAVLGGTVQLRWSPSGGTSTGTGVTDVGDFSLVLDQNLLASFSQWDQLLGVVPGTGRAAVRWIGDYTGGFSGSHLDLQIDDAQLFASASAPPLPQSGQTVHWTGAMSPIHLTTQQYVPAGGTLVVDAGVEVFIDFYNSTFGGPEIWVAGELVLDGAPGNPVVIDHGPGLAHLPSVHGNATLRHAVVRVKLGGELDVANCTFERSTPVDWASMTDSQWDTPGLFCGSYSSSGSSLRVVDSLFHNAVAEINETFAIVEGCLFDDSRLRFGRYFPASDVLVRGNTFRNLSETPPLVIDGWNADVRGNGFTNNLYPVQLAGGGLTPGSTFPTSGNLNDRILVVGGTQLFLHRTTVPAAPIPYYMPYGGNLNYYPADVEILPGARILMGAGAFISTQGQRLRLRGEPGNPVRFEAALAGSPWTTLQFAFNGNPLLQSHFEISGATYGIGAVDTLLLLQSGRFVDNVEGVRSGDFGKIGVSKSRFHSNQIGLHAVPGLQGPIETGYVFANWPNLPNEFVGNGQGAVGDTSGWSPSNAEGNWWGHASGPASASNPGGTGDSATLGLQVTPFLGAAPNFTDDPPLVRAMPSGDSRIVRVGEKVILSWTAEDDGTIVSQRLERIPNGGYDWFTPQVLVSGIPPGARSVEFTIQDWNAQNDPGPFVRIVATDDRGQEGFDEFRWVQDYAGVLEPVFATDLSAGVEIGQSFDFDWLGFDQGSFNVVLFFDDLNARWSRGTHIGQVDAMFNEMPAVSTDLARYGVDVFGHWTLSPYFRIRPDARVGDAAPDVQVVFPQAGQSFSGGSVIPLRWTASDDTLLRSFDVHVSCNGGWTWFPVATGLDAATRTLDWHLPASTGISGLRLRVLARDERFQVTSSTSGSFVITAGGWPIGEAFCLGDGSTTACPCGNPSSGTGRGCDNSAGSGGASLVAAGTPSLASDSLVLTTANQRPTGTSIVLQGTASVLPGLAFGQGLRCVAGTLKRLYVKFAAGGSITVPQPGDAPISARSAALGDAIGANQRRYYMIYYRDPVVLGGCPAVSTYNATHALVLSWGP